jgi:hypothetical protein
VTPDPRDCKSFPLKTGFNYAEVPFKTGSPVIIISCSGIQDSSNSNITVTGFTSKF